MKIDVWTSGRKHSVSINNCFVVTAIKSAFYVECVTGMYGEISLDAVNMMLEHKPQIVDSKALELREIREKLRVLLGNR